MKRVSLIISFCVVLGLFLSCTKTESQFIDGQTPNERYTEYINTVRSTLLAAEYGWMGMLRTPTNNNGFSVFLDFKNDSRVVMYSDFDATTRNTPKESSFALRNTGMPSLIFDTYNYLHLLSDPNSSVSGGNSGVGLSADFEFSIVKVSTDTIVLKGNLNNNNLILVRLDASQKDKLVNGGLEGNMDKFKAFFVGSENAYVDILIDGETRQLAIEFVDNRRVSYQIVEGEQIVSFSGPLYYGLDDIRLGKENTYKGINFVGAYFKESNRLFMVDDTGKEYEVKESSSPVIPLPPFLDSFGEGKRYYSSEFRPNMANALFQPIWDAIQSESVTKVNRYIGYMRLSLLSSGQLYVRVYRYAEGAGTTGSAAYSRLYFQPVTHADGSVSYTYISTGSDGGSSSSTVRNSSQVLEAFLRDNNFVWDWKNKAMTEGGLFVIDGDGKKTGVALTGTLGSS